MSRINVSVMAATGAAMSASFQNMIRQSSPPAYSADPYERKESRKDVGQTIRPSLVMASQPIKEDIAPQRYPAAELKMKTRKVKVGLFSSITIKEYA